VKSCLVVDDSKVIRRVARRILEELNFSIDECQRKVPDVVLLDWNMPVMNGLEFLRTLRGAQIERQPIVIFCTTENDLAHIRVAVDAGADEYIMKPFDRDIMEAKLVQVGLI
jgi:two-component system, chemotaxis family, chemotaxis protein CheY